MLWNASAINGYAIKASDGQIGTVSDFLFDDASWLVRWLVVDTGNWLSGRKVLLPPSVLGQLDAKERVFAVKLTMQQVKDSPEIDTDRPVSRQMETNVYDYYGWSPYWGTGFYMGGYGYMPGAGMASPYLGSQEEQRGYCRCTATRRGCASPQHRSGHRLPYSCQRRRDRSRRGLPHRGCRLEHPFPGRRYVELVVRREGTDLATVGTRDRLDGSAGEPRCRSSEGQGQPSIRCVQDGRLGLREPLPQLLRRHPAECCFLIECLSHSPS